MYWMILSTIFFFFYLIQANNLSSLKESSIFSRSIGHFFRHGCLRKSYSLHQLWLNNWKTDYVSWNGITAVIMSIRNNLKSDAGNTLTSFQSHSPWQPPTEPSLPVLSNQAPAPGNLMSEDKYWVCHKWHFLWREQIIFLDLPLFHIYDHFHASCIQILWWNTGRKINFQSDCYWNKKELQ